MNFKTPFKVLTTAALIGTLSLSAVAPGAASAAEKTVTAQAETPANFAIEKVVLVKGDSKISVSFDTYIDALGNETALNGYELAYVVAANGEVFALDTYVDFYEAGNTEEEVVEKLSKAGKTSEVTEVKDGAFNDGKLEPVEDTAATAKVESVKAINQTVDVAGKLTFQINNDGKEITAADLPEGYTANFKASANKLKDNATTNTTGEVAATPGDKFQFEVEIKDKDGKVVAKSERVTATVENYNDTVTAITGTTTKVNDLEVTDGKLALGDTATITAQGTTKGDDKVKDLTSATFSVDKPAVLTVGAQGAITPKAKGTAKVTVKVGDKTTTVTYTVGDARKLETATVDKEAVTLATGKAADVIVTLKDQYGLAFDPAKGDEGEIKVTATNADKSTALAEGVTTTQVQDKDGEVVAGSYKLTLKAGAKATTGDVDVKVDGKKVATVKVTVEAAGEVADYKLTANSTEFDLKDKKDTSKTLTIKAVDEKGLETTEQPTVSKDKDSAKTGEIYYRIAEEDEELATISTDGKSVELAKAKAGDTITVEAVKVTGAFHDVIKTLEFTVVDTTPVLKDVVFTSHPAVTEATVIDLDKILKVTAEGSKGEVKVAYTVADDAKALTIFEANKDGEATEVELGTVKLTNLPAGLGVKFVQAAEGKTQPTVTVTLVDQTASEDDSPQPAQNKGSFNIAVIDNDNNFKGDTTVDVNITKVTGAKEALNTIKAYGFDGTVDELEPKNEEELKAVKQKFTTLDNIATFLKVQYGATLNTQNLVAKDGKLEITGPLLSAADFKKIKGNKSGAYRLTIEGVAKIAISSDGTAVFEKIKEK